jgi:hypothetical protein
MSTKCTPIEKLTTLATVTCLPRFTRSDARIRKSSPDTVSDYDMLARPRPGAPSLRFVRHPTRARSPPPTLLCRSYYGHRPSAAGITAPAYYATGSVQWLLRTPRDERVPSTVARELYLIILVGNLHYIYREI